MEKLSNIEVSEKLSPQQEEAYKLFRNLPNPDESTKEMEDRVLDSLSRNFKDLPAWYNPVTKRTRVLEQVGDLTLKGKAAARDYGKIRSALVGKRTYGPRVVGKFKVVEKDSKGKTVEVLDEKEMVVAHMPTPIYDRSYIVEGKKHYLSNQFRRRPGAFTRVNQKGDTVTEVVVDPFNSSKLANFKVRFDRDKKDSDKIDFKIEYKGFNTGSKSIKAYDVYKIIGGSEKDFVKTLGQAAASGVIKRHTSKTRDDTSLKMYSMMTGKDGKEVSPKLREAFIRKEFGTSSISADLIEATMGLKGKGSVDHEVLLQSFRKLKAVANEDEEADGRESLAAKKVMSPIDLLAESVGHQKEVRSFQNSVAMRLRSKNPDVRLILGTKLNDKLLSRLKSSSVEKADDATNPLSNIAAATTTTVLGEGGIGDVNAISDDVKLIDGSHVGFLDPSFTPESKSSGIVLHTSTNTKIVRDRASITASSPGHSKLVTVLLNRKGKVVEIEPKDMRGKVIGGWDSYELRNGKPSAKGSLVKAFRNGKPVEVSASSVDFWFPSSNSTYTPNTALIPFVNSTQGNRVQYGAKQQVAAVPLLNREAPLVQVKMHGSSDTMESLLGTEMGAIYSAYDGKVTNIEDTPKGTYIHIKPKGKGKAIKVAIPKDVPMGGTSPLTADLKVKVGTSIKKGSLLADSNFTKDGKSALGLNLRAAYMPYYSATFEDSIAITEGAAKRLTSEHLYSESREGKDIRLSLDKYERMGGMLGKRERGNLDLSGVVKKGSIINPGDVIMAGATGVEFGDKKYHKLAAALGVYGSKDKYTMTKSTVALEKVWEGKTSGEVVDVKTRYARIKDEGMKVAKRVPIGATILIKTREPMAVGDKLIGRHGNKGVVGEIIPDDEAPVIKTTFVIDDPGRSKLKKGMSIPSNEFEKLKLTHPKLKGHNPKVEILLNPLGVPSRINPSQNFETFLGKIAAKTGLTEKVENYGYKSNWQYVKDRLKGAGVSDTDTIYDPKSGRNISGIGNGTQYFMKAKQTASKGLTGRGVGKWNAETKLALKGDDGAQALGELGIYSLMSQGAREFLKDAQLNKSELREEVWEAIRNGRDVPKGRYESHSFKRMKTYMKAAGINPVLNREESSYEMTPLTDADVVAMTQTKVGPGKPSINRILTRPTETIEAKSGKLHRGGLFDRKLTGGHSGSDWSRFELNAAMPNPVYERAITQMLDLKPTDFKKIMAGTKEVTVGKKTFTGSRAVEALLKDVDLASRYKEALVRAKDSKDPSKRSSEHRVLRSIRQLRKLKLKPSEAYMRKQVAVAPPSVRGISVEKDKGNEHNIGDLNYLYRDVALMNEELRNADAIGKMPAKVRGRMETGLYETLKTLAQVQGSKPLSSGYQGPMGMLTGTSLDKATGGSVGDQKKAMFKTQVVQRRQAFSGRAVLSPSGKLSMDEVALPRQIAASLGELHVEAEWKKRNPDSTHSSYGEDRESFLTRLKAYSKRGKKDAEIDSMLDTVYKDRYVMVKRDPALHMFNTQGFKVKLDKGKTLKLNPLVYSGFNADNDGDKMGIYLPLSHAAQAEVKSKMLPSKNLFNPTNERLVHTVGHEAILGLNRMTRRSRSKVRDVKSLKEAKRDHTLKSNDKIMIKGRVTSTGLERINAVLPTGVTLASLQEKGVLKVAANGMGKRDFNNLLGFIATEYPSSFGEVANGLRTIGQKEATISGATLSLHDLQPVIADARAKAGKQIQKDIADIKKQRHKSKAWRKNAIAGVFARNVKELDSKASEVWQKSFTTDKPFTTAEMVFSGARAKVNQLAQMVSAPVGMIDASGDVIDVPVMRNYSEGLRSTGIWTAAHGARQGAVSKVVQVQEPGALTKRIVNSAIAHTVTSVDCKTNDGVTLEVTNKSFGDLVGRTLSKRASVGSTSFRAGHTLTARDISHLLNKTKGKLRLKVRSPLTCDSDKGVCQKCHGVGGSGRFAKIGTHVGTQAAQALGEPTTQLALSSFHGGGRFEGKRVGMNQLRQAKFLLEMPKTAKGIKKSIVSPISGIVSSIEDNKISGGWDIKTRGSGPNLFVPKKYRAPDGSDLRSFFTKGKKIQKGMIVTDGLASPKDIFEHTGSLRVTQNYMVDKLHGLYKSEGVKRRNVETLVKTMTENVEVRDPGNTRLLPGSKIPLTKAKRISKSDKKFSYRPIVRGISVIPRDVREDWMGRMQSSHLQKSISEAAQMGAKSWFHSTNPLPALGVASEFSRRKDESSGRF